MRTNSLIRRCVLILTVTLFGAGVVLAAPAWKDLNSRQQAMIKPTLITQGGDFDRLPLQRREALVKGADRWLGMTPEQRTTATQQFQQWQLLSAQQKVLVLERRERFRKLSPEQRKALLETQKQFLEMPLQQQTELHNQFNDLQQNINGLPAQPFATPTSPTPGTTVPLGMPITSLPSGAVMLPPALGR